MPPESGRHRRLAPDHGLPPMEAPARGRDELGETPRPPHDAASAVFFDGVAVPPLRAEDIAAHRSKPRPTVEEVLAAFPDIGWREATYETADGAVLPLTVFRRRDDDAVGPCFLHVHGGGMVSGTRHDGLGPYLGQLREHGGAVVSVDYRLAPEHQAPIPVEDCYAALTWVVEHARMLGVDPDRVLLDGGSAGGGLAAGVMLLARDRGGPALLGVLLECPMLDDRGDTTSMRQFDLGGGFWSGRSNEVGWTALLGDARGTDEVSPYDAPARATWLGGLPPVFLTVGSTDPFRDEDVAFASAIWGDGGDCELHVLPGGPHGYAAVSPDASIVRSAATAQELWVRRLLQPDDLRAARAARDAYLDSFLSP